MRYECLGSPHCLKTFEFGHALRAHIASCEKAQKVLIANANVEKLERDIATDYNGIYGLHRNTYYPTAHHVDKTLKFQFADDPRFAPSSSENKTTTKPIRRLIKGSNSKVMNSTQVEQALKYES